MSERQQLLVVEAMLAKDPTNAELLETKEELLEAIALMEDLQEDEPIEETTNKNNKNSTVINSSTGAGGSKAGSSSQANLVDKNGRRIPTEAELLAKKKEKNRKKKAKLREKKKEELDIAESDKQTWQSFASKKGLKGLTKKSIFASPHSVTGKVGVGTNGIADAPSASLTMPKRKH